MSTETRAGTCDRCGGTEQVEVTDFCKQCGPVPLCWRCWTLHQNEVAKEERYFNGSER